MPAPVLHVLMIAVTGLSLPPTAVSSSASAV
jgi:hypothetical protein